MKSFGRLLKRLRGDTSLDAVAARASLPVTELLALETGARIPDSALARRVFQDGFGLDRRDADRLVLGVQLYDLGLKDNELRQLVVDIIVKATPTSIRQRLRELYRSYSE